MTDLIVLKPGVKISYARPYPKSFKGGKWEYGINQVDARIMAIAEGYVMLRRPRCVPFIESVKDLEKWRLE